MIMIIMVYVLLLLFIKFNKSRRMVRPWQEASVVGIFWDLYWPGFSSGCCSGSHSFWLSVPYGQKILSVCSCKRNEYNNEIIFEHTSKTVFHLLYGICVSVYSGMTTLNNHNNNCVQPPVAYGTTVVTCYSNVTF